MNSVHGKLTEDGHRRLEVFDRTTDGFEIAEAVLEIRGPGKLLGTGQSGLPLFRVAEPGTRPDVAGQGSRGWSPDDLAAALQA